MQRLDNHLGFSDKALAIHIIHLAGKHDEARDFKRVSDNGAEFPYSFAENLRIIKTLVKSIQRTRTK